MFTKLLPQAAAPPDQMCFLKGKSIGISKSFLPAPNARSAKNMKQIAIMNYYGKRDNLKRLESFDPKDHEKLIKENKYLVYNITYDPQSFCALDTLERAKKDALVVDVDKLPNAKEVREFLDKETRGMLYPKVYIKGKFIGTNANLEMLRRDGTLKNLSID